MREMTLDNFCKFIDLYQSLNLEVFIDGGWCVDALLGKQTRLHEDVDIAMSHDDMPKLREALEKDGFTLKSTDDWRECNFVLANNDGREIDFHTYRFNDKGNNVYGVAYEKNHLTGKASINGRDIKCIEPLVLIDFHTGYEPDENDFHDVKLLCEKYNQPLPRIYDKFEKKEAKI